MGSTEEEGALLSARPSFFSNANICKSQLSSYIFSHQLSTQAATPCTEPQISQVCIPAQVTSHTISSAPEVCHKPLDQLWSRKPLEVSFDTTQRAGLHLLMRTHPSNEVRRSWIHYHRLRCCLPLKVTLFILNDFYIKCLV